MNFKKIKAAGGKLRRAPGKMLSKSFGIQVYVEQKSLRSRSNFSEEQITLRYIEGLDIKEQYAVDIAAGDGLSMSNTYGLFRRGWGGLAVELDGDKFSQLAFHYKKFKNVRLAKCMVTPQNVLELLAAYQAPKQMGFLNLDIDGYDFFVLNALLGKYRPSLMCIEINEKIPPPLKFTVNFDLSYGWSEDHFFGQSISQLYSLCVKHNYDLIFLEYNNAFLVPHELNKWPALTPEVAYNEGYINRPDRKKKFFYNHDIDEVLSMPSDQAIRFLNNFFSKYQGKFTLSL